MGWRFISQPIGVGQQRQKGKVENGNRSKRRCGMNGNLGRRRGIRAAGPRGGGPPREEDARFCVWCERCCERMTWKMAAASFSSSVTQSLKSLTPPAGSCGLVSPFRTNNNRPAGHQAASLAFSFSAVVLGTGLQRIGRGGMTAPCDCVGSGCVGFFPQLACFCHVGILGETCPAAADIMDSMPEGARE